jgi:diguanylate cyclase (GGDEF)-like protein
MPDRIVITDARGEVLLLNDAVRSDHGGAALTSDAPVEQMGLYELDAETPLERHDLPPVRALAGERVAGREVVFRPPAAREPRRLLVNAAPVHDGEGRLLGAVTTASDITERREAEMRLAEVNLVLRAVRDATHDLPEDGDLAQAICQATRFASGASIVMLYQPDGDGYLVTTGAVGYDGELPIRLPLHADPPAGVVRAFATGLPIFAPDAPNHPYISPEWRERMSLASAILQPVGEGAEPVGVLAVGWREPVAGLSEPAAMSIGLLADEAALALERADLIAQLRDLSLRDPLTGLPNRRAWDTELEREMSRAKRHGYPLCVALLDLDHFKAYNDEMGHQGGDWLLRTASTAWATVLRDTDILARWGGEEFAVCLPNCSPAEAEGVLARLRALIPDRQSCSAGLAAWDGEESPADLLARADRALYEAKNTGRDRLVRAA